MHTHVIDTNWGINFQNVQLVFVEVRLAGHHWTLDSGFAAIWIRQREWHPNSKDLAVHFRGQCVCWSV